MRRLSFGTIRGVEPSIAPWELIGIARGLYSGIRFGLSAAAGRLAARAAERAAAEEAVSFGRNANQISHAFRHVDAAGLPRAEVQAAIRSNLQGVEMQAGKLHVGTVEVNGQTLQYNAYMLQDGTVNVGRINVP